MKKLRVGILGLQGCVTPHIAHLSALDCQAHIVKTEHDIHSIDALILPGGESTTLLKLIERFALEHALLSHIQKKPTWGICAGSILLASKVTLPQQKSFSALNIEVERNAFGGQKESFVAEVNGEAQAFIRAPSIRKLGNEVECLARFQGAPVWVIQNRIMATTFHPELGTSRPSSQHRYFVKLVR